LSHSHSTVLSRLCFSRSVQGHSSAPRETEPCERPASRTLVRSLDLLPHLRMCSSCSCSHLGGTMPPPVSARHVSATRAQQKTEAPEGVTEMSFQEETKQHRYTTKLTPLCWCLRPMGNTCMVSQGGCRHSGCSPNIDVRCVARDAISSQEACEHEFTAFSSTHM
jgi:hypothetical protein